MRLVSSALALFVAGIAPSQTPAPQEPAPAKAETTILNAMCGERDFEESFVKLAFSAADRVHL